MTHGLALDDTKGIYEEGKYFVRMLGQQGEAYYPVISEEHVLSAIEYVQTMSNSVEVKSTLDYLKSHLRIDPQEKP
jgi:hypothetical protein